MQTQERKQTTVWTRNDPYSLDPMAYDYFGHHLSFTATFAPLVSQYQRGATIGVIAEAWVSSSDFRTWEFTLRDGMTFSNGDPITPEAVLKSLKRVAWLQKLAKSKSGLFEHIVGLKSFQSPSDHLKGMTLEGHKLVLKFEDPVPQLLGSLSFGLYAIAHPDDYDSGTGEWNDPRQARTSGAYKVTEWTDHHLKLALHHGFPNNLRHEHAAHEITIVWKSEDSANADLHAGDSFESSLGDDFEFHTTSATTVSIAYAQCFTWNNETSPCHDLRMRRLLRREFYKTMERRGFKPARSFFPRQLTNFAGEPESIEEMGMQTSAQVFRIMLSRRNYPPFNLAMDALQTAASAIGLTPHASHAPGKTLSHLISGTPPNLPFDMATVVTGILLEDSRDARFMIQSKEGIRLPDPDGRLHEEAAKPELNYDKLEEILWDQAIIWPLAHFQAGLWARKDTFDFSQINLDLPATDFSWIGIKQ